MPFVPPVCKDLRNCTINTKDQNYFFYHRSALPVQIIRSILIRFSSSSSSSSSCSGSGSGSRSGSGSGSRNGSGSRSGSSSS